jgi:UDP-glucose 4-epimerase
MRILITGGAGFIGSHIAEYFNEKADVRVLDDLSSGDRKNLAGLKVELIEGSINDRGTVQRAMRGVDTIFHLAAMVSVPESMQRPVACVEANVLGLLNVLEAAVEAGVKKLCFSSSAAVYGENPAALKSETMVPDPRSPYAITKLDGEYYCGIFDRSERLRTVCLRYFNVFGPRQNPNSAYAAAVPIFIKQALLGQPLTIHGDGTQTRDFIYVKDVVAANVFAARSSQMTGVYNVGYGNQITVLDLASRILRATQSSSPIHYLPGRGGDIRHSCANVEKITNEGLRPSYNLEQGLAETIALLKETTQP